MKNIILSTALLLAAATAASAAPLGICTDGFGKPYSADACAAYLANSAYVRAHPSVDATSPAYIMRSVANDHEGN